MTDRMRAFRDRVNAEGWICPNPMPWNALWEMLPGKKQVGAVWSPSLPLILAAWDAPALMKKVRFLEHLSWADEHGAADAVIDYLESLSPADWYRL
jgi:hypothetical protein